MLTDLLDGRVVINLQYVKNAISAKCNKMRCQQMFFYAVSLHNLRLRKDFLNKIKTPRPSQVVQWLRLCAPNAKSLGSTSGQRTRSHMSQLKNPTCLNEDPVCHNKDPTQPIKKRIDKSATIKDFLFKIKQGLAGNLLDNPK